MKKNGTSKVCRTLYMEKDLWKKIDEHAIKEDRSANWMIGEIIRKWIDNKDRKK